MPDPIVGKPRPRKVPVILQQETAECGLVCLAMIAAHYGKHFSVDQLRQGSGTSSRGATINDLMRIAGDLQLTARPLRLTISELTRLRLPAVLHWRMNHFVVLVRRTRRHYLIHDPATGRRKVGSKEFDRSFTGVALELGPAYGFRRQKKRKSLSLADFAGSFRHLYRYFGFMFMLLLSTQVLALAPSIATQILIDELVLGQDREWLYRALAGLLLIMLTGVMLDGSRRWVGLFAGVNLSVDSSVSVMNHLFRLPVDFINRRHTGDLMSKLESLTPIREAITEHVMNSIVHAGVMLTTIAIMFFYSGWLTSVSLAGFALSAAVITMIMPASRRLRQHAIIHTALQNSSLVESLRAYDAIKILGLEHMRLSQWQNHFLDATNAGIREGRISIAQQTATGIIGSVEQILFLGVGIAGIVDNNLTLGILFAFMSLRTRFAAAALGLADAVQKFFLLKVHTDRLSDIVLVEPVPVSSPGTMHSTVRGSLKAENIAFSYGAGSRVVDDFSCDITAGSNVVITGPSGCGKTTVLKLLAGHLPVDKGQVYVDNVELSLWHLDSLRRQTGFVLQNDTLFQGSITENITAFDSSPDLTRLREAAIATEIWREIQVLPMRLQTQVSDMGRNLSGGQVQRLLLARALYRRPVILFLDEATSNLDINTERRVLRNIGELGFTIVSVAHRPDVIRRAQQVIRMDC